MEPLHTPAGYMTAHQVAAYLGITLSGVRDLVARGRLTRASGTPRQPRYDTATVLPLGNPTAFATMLATTRDNAA